MGVALIGRVLEDRRGAVALPFGLAITMMMASIGGAVDFNRWHNAKRVTSDAVDAAVLAGARALQMSPTDTSGALQKAASFFQRNIDGKVDLATNTVTFVLADSNRAVTATGSAVIDTSFLRIIGINQMTVISDAGAGFPKATLLYGGRGGSNIEVSLMLDVTGSMCDNNYGPCTAGTKITGLKDAAKKLVDTVIADDQSTYFSKMAIVPFSTRVRVGPDGGGGGMMTALTQLNPTWTGWYKECTQSTGGGGSEGNGNWQCLQFQPQQKTNWKVMPCVTDRFYNANWDWDYTDDAPGGGKWINAHDGGRMTRSWDSSNTPPTSQKGNNSSDPAEHWNYNAVGDCADIGNNNQIVPLSSDKAALKSHIDGLEAFGATAGALGTAWSWYVVSPKWSSVWTGTSRPGSYADVTTIQSNGKPLLRKVAILMTDGVYNTYRGWKDSDQQTVSTAAKQLCTNMKAQGIEIFTVGLALDLLTPTERSIAEDTLRSCGTDVSHFYATLDVDELNAAFQSIALQLSSVVLTR